MGVRSLQFNRVFFALLRFIYSLFDVCDSFIFTHIQYTYHRSIAVLFYVYSVEEMKRRDRFCIVHCMLCYYFIYWIWFQRFCQLFYAFLNENKINNLYVCFIRFFHVVFSWLPLPIDNLTQRSSISDLLSHRFFDCATATASKCVCLLFHVNFK